MFDSPEQLRSDGIGLDDQNASSSLDEDEEFQGGVVDDDDTEEECADGLQLEHEAQNLEDVVPRRSNHGMLDGVELPKQFRGSTPVVPSTARSNGPNTTSITSLSLNPNLVRAATLQLSFGTPPPYPLQSLPRDGRTNIPPQALTRPALTRPVLWSSPEMHSAHQTHIPPQSPVRGFYPFQNTYPPLSTTQMIGAQISLPHPAKHARPPSSMPPVKLPMPPQYAKRTPPKAANPPSSTGKPPQPPSMATPPKSLVVPVRARPTERPSEPIYDSVRPNMGTAISRCQACGNEHLPGQCPLRSQSLTVCPGCGYVHLHGTRTCPLFWEEEYVTLLQERLKESTEDRRLIESAAEYVRGVKGDLRRKSKGNL